MKRIVLVAAAAALLVGVACSPVKAPLKPSAPLRDTYQTSVSLTGSGAGAPYTVYVDCTLSNNFGLPSVSAQMNPGDTFFHNWGDLDITECEAIGPLGNYGASVGGPPTSTTPNQTSVDCYFYTGGQGKTQTCYFLINVP